MRPIKFRAWDKKEKKMYSNVCLGKAQRLDKFTPMISSVEMEGWLYDVNRVLHEAQDELEVMQFTGLHDNNGKEIYEGDIVTWNLGYNHKPIKSRQIRYDEELAGFMVGIDGFLGTIKDRDYEVIGNIYQDKHLLDGIQQES